MADTQNVIKTKIKLRNDSEQNWTTANPTLAKGEASIVFTGDGKTKIKVGDGKKTWQQLDYVGGDTEKHIATTDITQVKGTFNPGDIAIETKTIAGDKVSKTAYVWNGDDWEALDGNYNASNVYFSDNLTYTKGIGVIADPSGSATLNVAGKSVEDLFKQILAKESTSLNIDTDWSATFSASNNTITGEVGTTITTTPTFTLKTGDIPNWDSYGGVNSSGTKVGQNSTGSTFTGSILSGSTTLATKSGISAGSTNVASYTLPTSVWSSKTLTDTQQKHTITATGSATASTSKPITNLGNFVKGTTITNITETFAASTENYAAALGGFDAKTVTITGSSQSATATGCRKGFFGYRLATEDRLDFNNLTSDDIRNKIHATTFYFNAGNSKVSSKWPTKFTVPANSTQIIFAVPAGVVSTDHQYIKMSNVALGTYYFENNGLLRKIPTVEGTSKAVMVNGAIADTEIEYAIWTINPTGAFASTTEYNLEYGSSKKQ